MAKPRDHNLSSSMATDGWETAKGTAGGGIIGALTGMLGGAVAGPFAMFPLTLAAVGVGALIGAIPAGITVGTGALLGVAAVSLVGAAVGLVGGAGFGSVLGGMFGLAKGTDKVNHEKQLHHERMQRRLHKQEIETNNAGIAGMHEGYQAGFAEGQQYMVNQLRALQEQQMMAAALREQGGHTAKLVKEREAQAAVTPQLGA